MFYKIACALSKDRSACNMLIYDQLSQSGFWATYRDSARILLRLCRCCSRYHFDFSLFFDKITLDISCELTAKLTEE